MKAFMTASSGVEHEEFHLFCRVSTTISKTAHPVKRLPTLMVSTCRRVSASFKRSSENPGFATKSAANAST